MGTCNMHFSFLQPCQCELAGGCRRDNLNPTNSFDHVRNKTCGRVATGEQEPLLRGFVFCEHHEIGASLGTGCSIHDAICLRHEERRIRNWNTYPARSDLTNPNRLTLRKRTVAEYVRAQGLGRALAGVPKREEIIDCYFQLLRKVKGHFRVRHVCTRLDRIDRLSADVYSPRKVRGADPSALPYLSQTVLDTGVRQGISLTESLRALLSIRTDREARCK